MRLRTRHARSSAVPRPAATYLFDHELVDCDEQLAILAAKFIRAAGDVGLKTRILKEQTAIQSRREALAGIALRVERMDAVGRELIATAHADAEALSERVRARIAGATTQAEMDRARARLEEITHHGRHAQ